MRTTLHSFLAVLMALLLASAPAYAGGDDRSGTAGASQLLIPVGAKGIALGSSFSASMTGVNAIYYNPAGLSATKENAEAMFSHMWYFGNTGVDYVAVDGQFPGFGSLGITVKSLSFGDVAVTDERNPDGTGATYSPTFVVIGLTYARALTDRIRAGFSGYFVNEAVDRTSATNFVFDVGVQYQGLAGLRGLSMGVTLRHLGSTMQYGGPGLTQSADASGYKRGTQLLNVQAAEYSMPTSLELGLTYAHVFEKEHVLSIGGSFENNNFLSDQYRFGLEYAFRNFFFLRGSYNIPGSELNNDVQGNNPYIFGAAMGAGVIYDTGSLKLGVDYAYRWSDVLAGNHVFDISLGF
jgi:hypothetical protein